MTKCYIMYLLSYIFICQLNITYSWNMKAQKPSKNRTEMLTPWSRTGASSYLGIVAAHHLNAPKDDKQIFFTCKNDAKVVNISNFLIVKVKKKNCECSLINLNFLPRNCVKILHLILPEIELSQKLFLQR